MPEREEFAPEERDPDFEFYDVAPPDMPPSPAGANVEIGGEAAASRRHAGIPDDLADESTHTVGEATPGAEPILGYDGFGTEGVLDWIEEADPEVPQLRAILDYERSHLEREPIIEECTERLRALGDSTPS